MQINLFPDASLFAVMAIFFANYFVVRHFLVKPVNAVLEAREAEKKSSDQLHEQAMTRFNEAAATIEEQLHAAKRDAAQVREKFRAEAAAHRNRVVETTQKEAKKIVSQADDKLTREVGDAREKIKRESETLARVAAERILGRAV
jgi:F-type H+-transporting ATPase subunit b